MWPSPSEAARTDVAEFGDGRHNPGYTVARTVWRLKNAHHDRCGGLRDCQAGQVGQVLWRRLATTVASISRQDRDRANPT